MTADPRRDDLTPELRAWRDACRTFAEEVIRPWVRTCDRENRFASEVHRAAREQGFLNICIPERLGGRGMSWRAMAVGGEQLAAECPAIAFTLGFNHGALRPVLFAGTPAQQERFVGETVRSWGYASLCLTEPDVSGSNLLAAEARAIRRGDRWVLEGEKCMVGMGTVASLYLVLAQAEVDGRPRGPTVFAVPRTDAVTVGENTDKLGFRAVPTPTVTFRGVELTDEHVIGGVGEAEPVLLDTLDFIRFGGAPVIVGSVLGALRDALPWLEQRRVAPGDPLISKSSVQLALGRVYAEIQAVRALVWQAADRLDRGAPCSTETAIAKYLAAELAVRASSELAQLHGWRGLDGEWAISKRVRDARATTIFEGSSEVQLLTLFRALRRASRAGGWL